MPRQRLIGFLAALLLLLAGCTAPPTPTPTPGLKKVLLIASEKSTDMELALTQEVGVMTSLLANAGYRVVVATPSGQLLRGDAATLKPDLRLIDVKVADYAGVVVPCMGADVALLAAARPLEVEAIVKQIAAQGKPVAAQHSGVQFLSQAGVLNGKQFAQATNFERAPAGIYKGFGVVQDGNIITSGTCPLLMKPMVRIPGREDGTRELTQKLIDALAGGR
jgi:putative intracellular protease/amidase